MISATMLILILIIAVIMAGIWVIFKNLVMYKHRAIIKEITGSNKLITIHKLRIKKNKDGSENWELSNGVPLPVPDTPDCIELDHKGRKIITIYHKGGQYFYQNDKTIDKELISVQPYTNNQRAFFMAQHKKAELEKGLNWKENIPVIASASVLIVMAIIGYLIFDEYTKFQGEQTAVQNSMSERLINAIDGLKDVNSDVKIIKSAVVDDVGGVPN